MRWCSKKKKTKKTARQTKQTSPKQRKQRIQNALQRIKALEKISNNAEIEAPKKVKGNILSPGTSLASDARENDTPSYEDLVYERVKSNWVLPVWLSRQNLRATLLILLDRQGRVVRLQFKQRSGHPKFDEAAEDAIKNSQPFPPPDQEAARTVAIDGILLGFPL